MAEPVAQLLVFGVLAAALVLFVAGPWRYDIVALLAALVLALTGIIPADRLFLGFAHPAVVTVAAVLVVSRALSNAGVVAAVARLLGRVGDHPTVQVGSLGGLVAVCSTFMNNIGALALLMPVAIRMARKTERSPAFLLMPLAFASLLGGMVTLIGTPPNIIIATFRADTETAPFQMFDFAPVGLGVALAGLAFITLVGWRLIPQREGQASGEELFQIEEYMTELRVPEEAESLGSTLRQLVDAVDEEVVIVALLRNEQRIPAPHFRTTLRAGDILVVEADSEAIESLVQVGGLELSGSPEGRELLQSDDVVLLEAVVPPGAPIVGRSARGLNLRLRHGLNLLAVARQGRRLKARLRAVRFQPGDVLLLQGEETALEGAVTDLGCLPLAERQLSLGRPRRIVLALAVFGTAIAATTLGWLPVQVAFVTAGLGMVMVGLLSLREVYDSIDWPIIVLLGAMIPVGEALEATGGAALIAGQILQLGQLIPPAATLALILIGTMFLSDVINNAAAVVLMAPIAISVAVGLGASVDPFLMAVAIGGSAAFLTPIGHQSNTLVMGPAGYRFGDYWRMGLPLEVVVVAVALPLLLTFWPLGL